MAQENYKSDESDHLDIVICGGGIIGVCTAYYLTQKPNVRSVTIVERYQIAGCASGKAGGFLALDWCDGGHVVCIYESIKSPSKTSLCILLFKNRKHWPGNRLCCTGNWDPSTATNTCTDRLSHTVSVPNTPPIHQRVRNLKWRTSNGWTVTLQGAPRWAARRPMLRSIPVYFVKHWCN